LHGEICFSCYGYFASFDFEDNLDAWKLYYETEGSDFNITSDFANTGEYSARLEGRTRYRYGFVNETSMAFTSNTTVSFSWMFPNYAGYYIGIIIYTSGPGLYLMSHFSGIYGNNSGYMILEYDNEALNTWYAHTVNISSLFLDYYGSLPENLTSIHVINRGYGSSGDLLPTAQVTYYDSIFISNGEEDFPDPTITITTLGYGILTALSVLTVFVVIFTRKTKKN